MNKFLELSKEYPGSVRVAENGERYIPFQEGIQNSPEGEFFHGIAWEDGTIVGNNVTVIVE